MRGEHDLCGAAELAETLVSLIECEAVDLVVDLSGVDFLSVATVDVFCNARTLLEESSRSLTLRSPSRCAIRVLEFCELECGAESYEPATEFRECSAPGRGPGLTRATYVTTGFGGRVPRRD